MLHAGIVPHGGMLACYLQSLMRAGRWKVAAEVRERYRRGEELSRAEKHVDKFDFVAREDAVVDGVMANGLIDNGQHSLALKYVLEVLESRAKVSIPFHPIISHPIPSCPISSHHIPFHPIMSCSMFYRTPSVYNAWKA